MTTAAQRNASAALAEAERPLGRLDTTRGSEDLAADLIDVWDAVETALHTLIGNSGLGGQALIREARQRQFIDFDAANALAAFEAVHSRLLDVSYRPTAADIESARSAVARLETALIVPPPPEAPVTSTQPATGGPTNARDAISSAPSMPVGAVTATVPSPRTGMAGWIKAVIAVAIVAILAIGGYFVFGTRSGSDALQQGVDAYGAGNREVAVNAFNRAVREDPKASLPHVYLARMAREMGNFPLASQELTLALQADPSSAIALREMAANLLAQNKFELARRFYVRAVQADPSDESAQGYLGCTLIKLGRTAEGKNFLNRAGPGPWSNCVPPTSGGAGPNALSAPITP